MHTIKIENFGPISKAEMSIADIVFLIGEQASGKSNVAKLIYFCKTLNEELVNLIFKNGSEDWSVSMTTYFSILRKKFTNIFGLTKDLGEFCIVYSYSHDNKVTITPNPENTVNFQFSNQLLSDAASVWDNAKKMLLENKQKSHNMYAGYLVDHVAKQAILSRCQELFSDDAYSVYIPAGRALLSRQMLLQLIQGDELRRINQSESYLPFDIVDAPTRNYIAEVGRIREALIDESIDDPLINFLKYTSEEILKGSYVYRNNYDYIKLDDRKLVPLSYSSSGQQEVVWLLNLLFSYAVSGQKSLIIVEEPETHLHPDAQYLLTKYIAAFLNKTKSQVIVTTHSPYVLSSFNNLFYADKCGKKIENCEIAASIIPKQSWLKEEAFSAFIIEDSTLRNIKDESLAMVDVGELDVVASRQDAEYEKLLHISKGGSLN